MDPFDLRDGHVVLSAPTVEDIDRITELCQDAEIQRWTTLPVPYERGHAEGFVTGLAPNTWERGSATWGIRVAEDDSRRDRTRLVGMIGLDQVRDGSAEIGYWLDPLARGRGIMTQAVGLVLAAAFERLALRRVTWRAVIGNWPSWRVVWRHGFRREGVVRGDVVRGERADHWIGTLLREDHRAPAHPWDGPVPVRAVGPSEPAPAPPAAWGRDPETLVRQFHDVYEVPVATDGPRADRDRLGLRLALVAEEFAELVEAARGSVAAATIRAAWIQAEAADEGRRDTVATADALGDLVYVIYGMALELGIPLPEVIAEIHESNLSKLGPDGRPVLRADGKVLKGPGYRAPDVAGVLDRR